MATSIQNEWITRVLGIEFAPDPARQEVDGLKDRFAVIGADIKRVPGAAVLMPELREAITMANDGVPGAEAAADALEQAIADLSRAARMTALTAELDAARPSEAGFVAVAKARLRWAEVEASATLAADNLVNSAHALLDQEPYSSDPRAQEPETAALIEALRSRLPPLTAVTAAVNAALDSDGPGRAAAIAAAVTTIDSFLPQLQADPIMFKLESEAGSFPTVSLIGASLAELRAVLGDVGEEASASLRSAA